MRGDSAPDLMPAHNGTPSVSPKDILAARTKVPLHLLPAIAVVEGAIACKDGVDKGYGPYNWRERQIELMGYIGAIQRHCARVMDGENFDGDSPNGASHMGCIIATAAIVLDAQAHGMLVDNRPPRGKLSECELGTVSKRLNSMMEKT